MTDLEVAQLKIRLIESQMALLQYQHRDVQADIIRLTSEEKHQAHTDMRGMERADEPPPLKQE